MQAYDISKECITIPLDDDKVTGNSDKADTCDIKKKFKDPKYAKHNEKDRSVLATFVTISRHSL